ncbi:MAG: helix-turn-helix transcriptional regulator [Candidatus Edwardsbacteria bacterium]|nr:helix-turn-helix transcriptional regulator [Candidatus Edwardsbacteria bacterium]
MIPEKTKRRKVKITLRREAGYSQRDLQAETGISQRVIAYYEKNSQRPPTHLLPVLAKALGVTADQFLGMEKTERTPKTRDNRLYRRLSQLEKLPAKERKQIVQLLDTFLEKEKLRVGQLKQAGR